MKSWQLAKRQLAIFILGTTGEFASLSYKLRRELIERTCQLVKGGVPVLVGITDSAFSES
jgi:dihydrodipicolinate synthase/N-acetylneuraminate lyase